jgi:hypothetical protein
MKPLKYKLCSFELANRTYLLLPKLNAFQTKLVASRLASIGFELRPGRILVAKKAHQMIFVSTSGYCWSNQDPYDAIVPLIPELLTSAKELIGQGPLLGMYFHRKDEAGGMFVRLTSRVEQGPLWRKLREMDLCGTTPDELLVYSRILEAAIGGCSLLTDFPTDGSKSSIIGRRLYYESWLPATECISLIRTACERGERNAYFPKSGVIKFERLRRFSKRDMVEIVSNLGEWCQFGIME